MNSSVSTFLLPRLEKNGRVIDPQTIRTAVKREQLESSQPAFDAKRVKTEPTFNVDNNQNIGRSTPDTFLNQLAPQTSLHQQQDGDKVSGYPIALKVEPFYPKPGNLTNIAQPLNPSQQSSELQKLPLKRQSSPDSRHRRLLRFQFNKKYLSCLLMKEQAKLVNMQRSMQAECKTKMTLPEKQAILQKYKEQQSAIEATLKQVKMLLAKLQNFEKERDKLMQQKQRQQQALQQQLELQQQQQQRQPQNVYYVSREQMQKLNTGQYQTTNPIFQPYQGQQWSYAPGQQQPTVPPPLSLTEFGLSWGYADQLNNPPLVVQQSTPMGSVQAMPPIVNQHPAPSDGSFSTYSLPQSASPQSITSGSCLQTVSYGNLPQASTNYPLDPNLNQSMPEGANSANFSYPDLNPSQSSEDSLAFQNSDFNQLLNISSGQLFDARQQVDYNPEQLLNFFNEDETQPGPGEGAGGLFSASETSADGSNEPPSQSAVKVEASNSADIWDELLSIIQDD